MVRQVQKFVWYSLQTNLHSGVKVEHIGTLPETNDVLSPTILFGILCPPAEEEECHFCLEKITKRAISGA